MTELRKTPALMECDPLSFMGALMTCAQVGLEPGGALGQMYLVPFKGKVTPILGYRGMITLARNSGQIKSLTAEAVFKEDKFSYKLGLNEVLEHEPYQGEGSKGPLVGVYCIARLMGGGHQIGYMSKADVEAVRKASPSGNHKPWKDHYEEMAKKTIIRRMFKYLPMSVEMAKAHEVDAAVDQEKFDASRVLSGNLDDALVFDNDTGEILSDVEAKTQADELAESLA